MNDWAESIETQKERFDDLYYEAFNAVKDRLIDHFFSTDNWTNAQIEEITGKTLYAAEGLEPEDVAEYVSGDGEIDWRSFEEDNGYLSINTWDSEYLDDLLRESTDIDLDTMLRFAESYGVDLSGIEIPYKMIIFSNEICDEDTAFPEQIENYVVCHNKEDLIERWKEYLPQYEGWQYCVKSGDSGCHLSGVYDPNDLDNLEELPSYICTFDFSCQVTGYLELDVEYPLDADSYKEAMGKLWDEADLGDCRDADAEETSANVLKVTGHYSGAVQAYTTNGAIARAEDAFSNANFEDLRDITFEELKVEIAAEKPKQKEKHKEEREF